MNDEGEKTAILFEGALTEGEFRQTQNMVQSPPNKADAKPPSFTDSLVVIGVIAGITAILLWGYLLVKDWFQWPSILAGFLALASLAAFGLHRYLTVIVPRQSWKDYAARGHYYNGRITDESVTFSCAACSVTTRYNWEGFVSYGEFTDGLVLYQKNSSSVTLSRRFFVDEEEWKIFREIVAAKLPVTHNVLPGKLAQRASVSIVQSDERVTNMPPKRTKSAFVMGSIFVATTFLSVIAMQMLSAPEGGIETVLKSYVVSQDPTEKLPGWAVFLLLLVVMSWLLSLFIRFGDERHFGWRGALGWAVAGFIYAMWLRSIVHAVSHSGMQRADTAVVLLALFGLIVSLGIAFGLGRGQTRSDSDNKETSCEPPEAEQAV